MKKLLLTAFAMVLALTGCSASSSAEKDNKDKDTVVIGFSMATIQEERWTKDRNYFMADAKDLGAQVIVTNSDNDPEQQLKDVKYLLQQKIDVLVITPQSATNAAQCVELAKQEGIPVLSYDRLVLNAGADVYVSFDSHMVGQKMAEAAVKAVPKGNYLLIHGSPEDNNSKYFRAGYEDYLYPFRARQDIKVVGEKSAKDWRREEAYYFVQEYMQRGEKIDAIICANDGLASGAVEALAESQQAGKVIVTGHDAELSACQRIVEGTQLVTIYKPIRTIAQKAAEVAIQLARHEKINYTETINDGKYNVPNIKLDVIAVDKNNMDDVIIKDGFHLRDEVYQNISPEKTK
jgi:D-xylose transport system substrate-binding protein